VSLRPGGVPFRRLASNINIVDGSNGAAAQQQPRAPFQVHDPHAPGAVILNKSQWEAGKDASTGVSTVSAVVLDPFLMRHLRPHQVAGVKFLYECVMGLRDPAHLGAILADGMGLGKTLQTIALLWTLLKQGPTGRPAVAKALVVTPSSLTRNWAQEIRKWLGDERLRTIIIEPGAAGAQQVLDFKGGTVARVAIVSYETLRLHADALAGCVGVLVADEGHRLKSAAGNKTISALLALKCQRRILLTGTPIQNNLSEFYAMCDFVCGDVLGSLAVFNRVFGGPIARSRERGASPDDIALGAARSEELARRVEAFVLRRGSEINAAHLPPMSLFVVFCRPTPVQLRALSDVLGSGSVRRLLSASGSDFGDQALSILTMLRKICNHPALHAPAPGEGDGAKSLMNDNAACDGKAPGSVDFAQSGKLAVLAVLLEHIIGAGDRCVVVSQSTAMLDLVSAMCAGKGYSTVRIDGSTDVSKRQDVVNSFNSYNVGQVFLLSTTAGGAGLNLTGANRLVLCDSHWNPAMDAQVRSFH